MSESRKTRPGIPMTEDAVKEWEKAFIDIEESIEAMYEAEEKLNPNAKYMRLKQQELPLL